MAAGQMKGDPAVMEKAIYQAFGLKIVPRQ
jgi:hypothetical protein